MMHEKKEIRIETQFLSYDKWQKILYVSYCHITDTAGLIKAFDHPVMGH